MVKENKKKSIFIIFVVAALLIVSFYIYNLVAKADADANKVAIKDASIIKIDTGEEDFDNDGLDYSDSSSYTKSEGYTAGSDSNSKNRIVRSFDTLTYHFNYSITGKDSQADYEERKVTITVLLSEENSKYITFDKNSSPGEATHTFEFDGIDTYGSFENEVKLYVLGAPNGMKINPKFLIQESTNTDSDYSISLGCLNFEEDKYNYSYDSENQNKYSTSPTVQGFTNYMPTITSSKTAQMRLNVVSSQEGQKATYNDLVGRYLTYVIGLEILGDNNKGIKGYTMPNGDDINFNINVTQDAQSTAILENNWLREYTTNSLTNIEPVIVSLPYSSEINNPGNITLQKNDNTYSAVVNGYNMSFESAKLSANKEELSKSNHYIGTYALTIFSPRNQSDGKNDINATVQVSDASVKDTAGNNINIIGTSKTIVNKYYEVNDYSLTGKFYDASDSKLSKTNGDASASKGSELTFKTTFNYKKTLSNQGLKEVIKVDPKAFKVIANGNKDISIKIDAKEGSNISEDDFEVSFISGGFENTNYNVSIPAKVSSEDLGSIQSSCEIVQSELSTYSNDQVMNLYGGPCLSSNENFEKKFSKISDAQDEGKEIPITKIIVQTKKGINLPDTVKITVEVKLKVRNVSDITKTYQVTAMASSSDYDDTITYYSPRVSNDENSITNPNNYRKTVYEGSSIKEVDGDSSWGDTLKIVNFTSREVVTVTNKNTDGSTKINYNVSDGETINYNIKTIIEDANQNVGADDVWYINNLKVYVTIPKGLVYIPDKKLGKPIVTNQADGSTLLIYTLPYTKPNMKIPEINFKASLSPDIKGTGVELKVTSTIEAMNINNERDTSFFERLSGGFTIYATGIQNVILSQKIGDQGSVIEKNSEFSYLLSAYNNTNTSINDYEIMNILPSSGDKNGSLFKGSYKVKITLPNSLGNAKVTCSQKSYSKLFNEVNNSLNEFESCKILDDYVDATAIKISNINIDANSYMENIKVSIKPEKNEYSDKYINSFIGASKTFSQTSSNNIEVKVISRKISGRVFIDLNENGIEDDEETYLENIPVSIYKLDSSNNVTKVEETVTNKNGEYIFKDLDTGRYKIRANYDGSKYDLTLRYATEDTTHDSDGYKIDENIIEISNKRTPNESDGIRVTRDIESVENMNIGLISRKTFGFDIQKYITKIELVSNGIPSTTNYNNLNKVSLSVRNTYSARVYYGIKITNNSTQAGYVKKIEESIPGKMRFNAQDEYNSQWISSNGTLQSIALENELIQPGEEKYLKIVLDIPTTDVADTFINEVTIIDIQSYEPEPESEDSNAKDNSYKFAEAVTYAGINWHVINTQNSESGEQILTLLADSGTIPEKMSHISNSGTYKWSESLINSYINGRVFEESNTLDIPVLYDNEICDDASGLKVASHGGTLKEEGTCQSGIYTNSKVRLLTEKEFNQIMANNDEDKSWLGITSEFWLMNSSYANQEYDPYGQIIESTNVKNYAKYVSNLASVQDADAKTKKEVRPVITISSRNIISE